jgi:hypothetical protein
MIAFQKIIEKDYFPNDFLSSSMSTFLITGIAVNCLILITRVV